MAVQEKPTASTRRLTGRAPVLLGAVAVVLAVVIAGCGGYGNASQSGAGGAPAAHGYGAAAKASAGGGAARSSAPRVQRESPRRAATGGIPQHNGGDQDSDNNGGPSDGDGSI